MQRAQQFRRRLVATGVAVLAILLLAFSVAFRSAGKAEGLDQWVAHTREVLVAIADTRFTRTRMANETQKYCASRDAAALDDFQADRSRLQSDLERLRKLTADNPEQQSLLAELTPILNSYVTSLVQAIHQTSPQGKTSPGELSPAMDTPSAMPQIFSIFDELAANERVLLASRSAAFARVADQKHIVRFLFAVCLLVLAILAAAGYLIQREITRREQVEEGLRNTQELLKEKAAALTISEAEFRKQYAILDSVLDSMAEGVVVANGEGSFTLFNPAAEEILGVGRADIPPAEWSQYYQLYKPDQTTPLPSEQGPLARALRGEATDDVQMCVRNRHRSTPSFISVSGRPLITPQGHANGGLIVFHDITKLIEANCELEAFNYSVSHDLRAPLRHMDGYSRILEEEFASKLPEQAQHYIGRIRSAATRLHGLVEDMLLLSRTGRKTLRLESVSLGELVEEVRADVMLEAEGRDIQWRIHDLPDVDADPLLLRQVLTNLFCNAVKFSRHVNPAVIEVGSLEKTGEFTLFVRDNGAGFDPRYSDKLFDVFQRLHRQDEFEGTGIGLATAQRIVHKHGGRIWAESQPGQGATFFFTLGVPVGEVAIPGKDLGAPA